MEKENKAERTRFRHSFVSEKVSITKQLEALRAISTQFQLSRQPVTTDQMTRLLNVSIATVKLLRPFFTDIGLWHKEKNGYVPSNEVVEFAQAFEKDPVDASKKLFPILQRSWCGQVLQSGLQSGVIREKEALDLIIEAAGGREMHRPKARAVLEFLDKTGFIVRENEIIKAANFPAESRVTEKKRRTTREASSMNKESHVDSSTDSSISHGGIHFHIVIDISQRELAKWDPAAVGGFFAGISQLLKEARTRIKH